MGHNHDDTNSFYRFKGGKWLATEREGIGLDETHGHNTLLIDGQGQYRPVAHYREADEFEGSDGFIQRTANTAHFDYISANATNRYRQIPGMKAVNREVLFVRPDYFLMFDNIEAGEQHSYEWIVHFQEGSEIENNWIRGNAGDEQVLGVGIISPQKFSINTGVDVLPYVRISPEQPMANVRFLNVLYPTVSSAWQVKPAVTIVDENDVALLAQLKMQNGSGRIDEVIFTEKPARNEKIGKYVFTGKLAAITQSQELGVEKLFLLDCKYLKDDSSGIEFIKTEAENATVEFSFDEKTISIFGDVTQQIVLYGPTIETIVLNKKAIQYTRRGDYVFIFGDTTPPSPPVGVKATPSEGD
ncbi:MAG: hypothetical protein DWQ10_12065 [Calditrichaeota bacterium]|nr:MAG: hypothetical protein DWQ10_12065 [Calditrichota bacterium]